MASIIDNSTHSDRRMNECAKTTMMTVDNTNILIQLQTEGSDRQDRLMKSAKVREEKKEIR